MMARNDKKSRFPLKSGLQMTVNFVYHFVTYLHPVIMVVPLVHAVLMAVLICNAYINEVYMYNTLSEDTHHGTDTIHKYHTE